MTVSAAMIARLRRMVNEATTATYTDAALTTIIERYPMIDERGVNPYYWDTSTDPPTQTAVTGWIDTYDLASAASDIWNEKASVLSDEVDENHEGRTYTYSQIYAQALRQARFWHSRRSAKTVKLIATPSRIRRGDAYVGNLPETDYP
jgi:hypothetical protein